MAIDRKRHAVDRLRPDVLVLQETKADPALARELGVSFLWRGVNASKGFAVVGFGGWCVEPLRVLVDLPWVLPVRLIAPDGQQAFDLLAIWTVKNASGGHAYARQIAVAIDCWSEVLSGGQTALAGDFNCSLQGPSPKAHLANLLRLEELGLRSVYHEHVGVGYGNEREMTLRWVGPGRIPSEYHCDFIFLPQSMLGRMLGAEVGLMADWVEPRLSDHCPIVADLAWPELAE